MSSLYHGVLKIGCDNPDAAAAKQLIEDSEGREHKS